MVTPPAAPDEATARAWMSTFIQCLLEGQQRKWMTGLRVDANFNLLALTLNYSLATWRNDRSVNRDERVFFRRLVTAYPYLTRADQEVFFEDLPAAGLACCLQTKGIALSWASNTAWEAQSLRVNLLSLSTEESIVASIEEVRNIAKPGHWQIHAEAIREGFIEEIQTGVQLVDLAGRAFRHIEFCPCSCFTDRANDRQ